MRFLKLCFVLMIFSFSVKAQEKDSCFYHVSFGHWQWNYCYGRDTIPIFDLNGEVNHDSVVMGSYNHPSYFIFESKHRTQVAVSYLTVTSMDGETKYEISSYDIIANPESPDMKIVHCKGANTGVDGIGMLYEATKGEHLQLNNIKIFDPVLKKKIVLPGIDILVK